MQSVRMACIEDSCGQKFQNPRQDVLLSALPLPSNMLSRCRSTYNTKEIISIWVKEDRCCFASVQRSWLENRLVRELSRYVWFHFRWYCFVKSLQLYLRYMVFELQALWCKISKTMILCSWWNQGYHCIYITYS